jgi:outer membrane receptor protein involved in Fe transport
VPDELATLLDARVDFFGDPNPDGNWTLNGDTDFLGPRRSYNETELYQVLVGFKGDLPIGDWTYDVYGSHGKTTVVARMEGFASLERYRAIVTAPNYGMDLHDFGSNTLLGFKGDCTTGLPIFDQFEVSQDCIDSIAANMKQTTTLKQDIVEGTAQGALFDLPAGEVRGAVGGTYRKNTLIFRPDVLLDAQSFLDQPIGLFASNGTQGSTSVKEVYGELLVPVLSEVPGIERLELELGGRISDYNTAGTIETYKALGNWTVNDYVSLRGGYQLANRAPNVAELFQGQAQSVVGFGPSDPCLFNTSAPWGNVPDNPNRADVIELCKQLNPSPDVFYNQGDNALTWAGPFNGPFPLELGVVVGNPDLQSEKAKTITFGGIIRSPFEGEMLSDIMATIDFYQIKVNNTIAPTNAVAVYQDCLNGFGNNPDFDPDYISCTYITRDNLGYRLRVDTPYVNTGKLITRGIDFTVNWAFPVGDLGRLNINYQGNYLLNFKAQDTPQTPIFENRGTFGQGGQFRFKSVATATFFKDAWSVGLRWRHLSSIKDATYVQNPNTAILGVGAYDKFDMFGNWSVSDNVSVRAGIDNLLDKQPPRTGVNPGSNNGLGTNANYYDVVGRHYYAGVGLSF